MKPGDKFAVNLNEHVVAEAVVIDIEDGKVTLDIPATRIVMGVKSSLTDLPDTTPAVEHQILGAEDRVTGTAPQNTNVSAQPTPKATDTNSPTQELQPQAASQLQPQAAPVVEAKPGLAPDDIGDGLASVPLKEME